MSDFGNLYSPIGRKEYRCEWCFGPIPKGEKHKHYVGVWEGEWQNWRMHYECYEQHQDDNNCEGFMPGEGEMPDRVKQLIEGGE